MTTRRDFLKSSTLLGFGATVPTFLGRTARAADPAKNKETILVVVQLTGGNDGLNTVIPYTNPLYAKYRPTIGIPADKVFTLNKEFGLHPALAGIGRLINDLNAGCVIQGVGYPNPDQSHFRSMDIWHAASTAKSLNEGWLGKSLKAKPAGAFHLAAENETAPLALAGAPARVPSINSLADFQLKFAAASGADKASQKKLVEAVASGEAEQPGLLDFVRRTQTDTYATTDRLQKIGKNYEPKVPYPANSFGERLKLAAQLIDADLGTRIFYVSQENYDTHAGQGGVTGSHANLLTTLGDGLSAFYRDLKERGHADRLCMMTFSEFGRRAKENGSAGTDHGSGAPMFLLGGKLKAGLIGEHPDLEKLDDGNLKHTVDFRSVYAAVLDQWLGIDSKTVLGAKYDPVAAFKA
ncbi:DUF1501 domain-containing protein [soil metagenome]